MNVLVIGKGGQLSWELGRLTTEGVEFTFIGQDQLNLAELDSIAATLSQYRPDAVINAAAYTAVDLAESEREKAFLVNATAVGKISEYCREVGAYLVQISTDFVFDGNKSTPYQVDDAVSPVSVYGESKAESEALVTEILPEKSCIIRTSWVYSTHGNNFVKSMLNLMQSKDELGIIADQIGTPTYAKGLADACIAAVKNRITGIYHFTDAGVASWYDFAQAVQELGIKHGLLEKAIPIKAIPTSAYPTPAKRPHFSVLDKSGILQSCPELTHKHWREQLESMILKLKG